MTSYPHLWYVCTWPWLYPTQGWAEWVRSHSFDHAESLEIMANLALAYNE